MLYATLTPTATGILERMEKAQTALPARRVVVQEMF